jgi:phage shock protein A
MVLPRKVRHDMLRRDWDVTQRQIADSVRTNVKVKNQRKATVNNLGKATKVEEAMESASRKLKRLITFQKPVSRQVKELEAMANEANCRRSQLKLELNMAGEYSDGSGCDTREETPEALDTSTTTGTGSSR